jgi:hypothetical protein
MDLKESMHYLPIPISSSTSAKESNEFPAQGVTACLTPSIRATVVGRFPFREYCRCD